MQWVWDLPLEYTHLLALELALEIKSDKSGELPTYWELFFFFFKLTIYYIELEGRLL